MPEGAVALQQVEQLVDQPDQLEPEGLEGLVPLTVPVGVGDDRDPACRIAGVRRSRGQGPVLRLVGLQL